MSANTEDIIIRCRSGEREAFRALVRSYQRMVFSLALKMLADEDEAYFKAYADEMDAQRQMEVRQWVAIVRVLAAELSEKQRLVFTLVHFENLETEEVEKITGMDAAKIKSNLYVARQTIRERLIKMGYEKG
ncbi:MAG: sigma factor-like helix-turn-helix DNA-binding protein [Bacteroidia bacterium]|nr:sigma factor-like helix-turn-helix DNA-binding protein [Bacteroidia bacterium]